MDFKGWEDLDTRQWWIAALLVSGSLLVGAASTGHTTTTIIAAGAVVWSIAEWIQHPYQVSISNGMKITAYHRRWSPFGTVLDIVGIGIILFALVRYVRLGGRLL